MKSFILCMKKVKQVVGQLDQLRILSYAKVAQPVLLLSELARISPFDL